MKPEKILITGVTGNIGNEIIHGLNEIKTNHCIIAAHYNIDYAQKVLKEYNINEFRKLDFTDPKTFDQALENIDIIFLLRPPQLADVPKYFLPFMQVMKQKGISKIVFLSVQGVENQKFIPHFKIEKLIKDEDFDYIFLRPGYFMQNLSTILVHELKTANQIFIPSGNLKFNWVDVRDIGAVGVQILNDFEKFKNKSYEITGSEFIGFSEVAQILTEVLGKKITYKSPTFVEFYISKRKMGLSKAMIFVMIILHYLPRLGKNQPRSTDVVKEITAKEPGTIREFADHEKLSLL